MSLEKQKPEKEKTTLEAERHSYNNPDDLLNFGGQEAEMILKILNNLPAYSIEMSEENGLQYVLVRSKKDDSVIYKTRNPVAMERLFPRED